MNREEDDHDVSSVYVYNGVYEVPMDVTHVRVDHSVTVIPERAFRGRPHLVEIDLPDGLITIEDKAFQGCESLNRMNIPPTIEGIGERAFQSCAKLDDIILPHRLRQLGRWAFCHCESLKSINIPPSIKTIEQATFLSCYNLTEVEFPEGLLEISQDAFSYCRSLVSINLPSTLKVIGFESFEGCERLNEVHMPDTIESIEEGAFGDCNLLNLRIPPLMIEVDMGKFYYNGGLVSVELSDNVTDLKDSLYDEDDIEQYPLRNIALPSECSVKNADILENSNLRVAFPDGDNETMVAALQNRFDNLPIHKICYYQSYHDNETTIQHLKQEFNELNVSGKEQDCLGMTPLHILACSTKHNVEVYQLLIDKYPETLIMKDKWGDIPLLYAIWCSAPTEVVDLLVESYKSLHPDYEFDWSRMIEIMAKHHVPLANIQKLISTQKRYSPDYEFDMQRIILQLATSDTGRAAFGRRGTSIETFRYLLRLNITKRLDSLDVTRFSEEMENVISALPEDAENRMRETQAVYDRLATYESIKEGTSVLELTLWKAKIDESRNKRARVGGEVDYRGQCRINSGADIVIRNVMPYLLPE